MSALDDDVLRSRPVTDLGAIAAMRLSALADHGYRLPLQDAERAAGMTETDIWRFETTDQPTR